VDLPPFIFAILFSVEKQTCGPETRALNESVGPVISDFEFRIFWFSFSIRLPHSTFRILVARPAPAPGRRAPLESGRVESALSG
jgi:hypothetical protein